MSHASAMPSACIDMTADSRSVSNINEGTVGLERTSSRASTAFFSACEDEHGQHGTVAVELEAESCSTSCEANSRIMSSSEFSHSSKFRLTLDGDRVTVQIGLDGLKIFDASTNRSIRSLDLGHISRWGSGPLPMRPAQRGW